MYFDFLSWENALTHILWFVEDCRSSLVTVLSLGTRERCNYKSTLFQYICDDTISKNTIFAGILLGITFGVIGVTVAILTRWRRLVLIGIFASAAICLFVTNVLRQPVLNLIVFTLIQDTAICIGLVASYFVDMYPTTHR